MKKNLIVLIWLNTLCASVYSQSYQINFTASGASSNIDLVKIENLTQGSSTTINGNESLTLVLSGTYLFTTDDKQGRNLKIYPNPLSEHCLVEFRTSVKGNVYMDIVTLTGKKLISYKNTLESGKHLFSITGLNRGMYLLNIQTPEYAASSKIISDVNHPDKVNLKYQGVQSAAFDIGKLKSKTSVNSMFYNPGDLLKFTATSGNYKTILMDAPALSKTLNFWFVPCSDADGNHYSTIEINNRIWMAENLKTTKYNNGVTIPNISDNSGWNNTAAGSYCWYNNEFQYKNTYGALYNWYAIKDGNLCPTGWYIPSGSDWDNLIISLGGNNIAGGKLKETGFLHWKTPNYKATNITGFSALPAGARMNRGNFTELEEAAYFWSSSVTSEGDVCGIALWFDGEELDQGCDTFVNNGISVRCIQQVPDSVNVTFQVDMQNSTISADGVFLNGSFCNWTNFVTMVPTGEGAVFKKTLKLKVGDWVTYKFINGYTQGILNYENATDSCSYGNTRNRLIIVPNRDVIVGLTCFNGCGPCKAISKDSVNVTFQVNMENEVVSSKGLILAGSFNNWLAGFEMLKNGEGNIYSRTMRLRVGEEVTYKYVNGAISDYYVYENATDTCSVDNYRNRKIIVPNKDLTLGVTCYNGCGNCPILAGDSVKVVFRVRMQGITVSADGVYITGNFKNYPNGLKMGYAYGYYYRTLTLKKGDIINYKFVNGLPTNAENYEKITGTCAVGADGSRQIMVPYQKWIMDVVNFGTCN